MIKNDCHFLMDYGICGVLMKSCDGKCTFYKTEKRFTEDQDKSIMMCRERGLCENCKYTNVPCKLSTDPPAKMSG